MAGMKIACKELVAKFDGKLELGRCGSRWEDDIKVDLIEKGCGLD
jgi:hypothetical protein